MRDPLREIVDGNWISKWDWNTSTLTRLLTADGAASNNGTKAECRADGRHPGRLARRSDLPLGRQHSLRIYTTTIPATNRLYTLMHDPQYRLAIAWQNVGYNQPPHPSFFIGDGMVQPPAPNVWHRDTDAPAFSKLAPSLRSLPAVGILLPVFIKAELVDLLDGQAKARIVNVTSSGDDGKRRRHQLPDVVILDDLVVLLRAERDRNADRVYTIDVEGVDASGNTIVESVEVTVTRNWFPW